MPGRLIAMRRSRLRKILEINQSALRDRIRDERILRVRQEAAEREAADTQPQKNASRPWLAKGRLIDRLMDTRLGSPEAREIINAIYALDGDIPPSQRTGKDIPCLCLVEDPENASSSETTSPSPSSVSALTVCG